MAKQDEEYTSQPLFDEIDPWSRNLKTDFYTFLSNNPPAGGSGEYGPSALFDGFYDRGLHERPILHFVIGRLGQHSLDLVERDASLAANKQVTAIEIPELIIKSLKRVRPAGEWTTDEKQRNLRKSLLADGLLGHTNYPIVAGAFQLSEVLALDGHEDYALDTIAATAKWLQRVDDIKARTPINTGDPAA